MPAKYKQNFRDNLHIYTFISHVILLNGRSICFSFIYPFMDIFSLHLAFVSPHAISGGKVGW